MLLLQPVNTNDFARQIALRLKRFVNPGGEDYEIWVKGAGQNPCMGFLVLMQPNKMAAIEGQEDTLFLCGKRQDIFIWQGLPGFAYLLNGENIMSKPAEFLDSLHGKIFVRSKAAPSGCLVGVNLRINFLAVASLVCPGIGEVLSAQSRIGTQ